LPFALAKVARAKGRGSNSRFQVQSVNDILNKVIPVFRDTRFNTKKQKHFEIVIKICELINKNGYSKKEDLLKKVELAWDMNKATNRKLSKEEYISKFINIKKT
jgi:predicted transcriptional regulator